MFSLPPLVTRVIITLCMTSIFILKLSISIFKSSEYTSLDWDSYIFRIINLTNKNSNLDEITITKGHLLFHFQKWWWC